MTDIIKQREEFDKSQIAEGKELDGIHFSLGIKDHEKRMKALSLPMKDSIENESNFILIYSPCQLYFLAKICNDLNLLFYICLNAPRKENIYVVARIRAPKDIVDSMIREINRMEKSLKAPFELAGKESIDLNEVEVRVLEGI
jgi:hypothetical protein